MPRFLFGGTPALVTRSPAGPAIPGARGTAWSAQTGGVRYTDLLDEEGRPIPDGVLISDRQARLRFFGPNNVDELWVDFGRGRLLVHATGLADRIDAIEDALLVATTTAQDVTARLQTLEASAGQPNGLATLDSGGRIPAEQLPAAVPPRLAELSDVSPVPPLDGTLLVNPDGQLWRPGFPGPEFYPDELPKGVALLDIRLPGQMPGPYPQTLAWAVSASIPIWVDVIRTGEGILVPSAFLSQLNPHLGLSTDIASIYQSPLATAIGHPAAADLSFGTWSTGYPVITVDEILTQVDGRVPVFLFASNTADVPAIVELVLRHRAQEWVVVGSIGLAGAAAAAQAGIQAMGYASSPNLGGHRPPPAMVIATGARWLLFAADSAYPELAEQYVAADLRVLVHAFDHVSRDEWGDGPYGWITSEPLYLGDPGRYRTAASPYRGQAPWPGMFVKHGVADRGTFLAPDRWVVPQLLSGPFESSTWVTQGWANPIPYDVDGAAEIRWTWRAESVGDASGWTWTAHLSTTDQSAELNGYEVRLAYPSGKLSVHRWVDGVVTELASATVLGLLPGQDVQMELHVVLNEIHVLRNGVKTLIVEDDDLLTQPPRYLSFGHAIGPGPGLEEPGGLKLPGAVGSFAFTPHHPALTTPNRFGVRVEITPNTWRPASEQTIAAKYIGIGLRRSWRLRLQSDGRLRLDVSNDGFSTENYVSTIAAASPSAGRLCVGLDWAGHAGSVSRCIYYTAPSMDGPWVELGDPLEAAELTMLSSDAPVEVGSREGGTLEMFAGTIHSFELRDGGFDGVIVAKVDFSRLAPGLTTFLDATGRTWTVQGSARIVLPPTHFVSVRAAEITTHEGPIEPALYDVDRYDSDGLTVAAPFQVGVDTALLVNVDAPALCPTDPDEFPLVIAVADWELEVTAITGASSPQAFTISQTPVAGPATGTIPAGAEIHPAKIPRYLP